MKRYAFDLGTQSIGWCVLDFEDEIPRILDLGVRIFPDGREPGRNGRMGDPLNAKRRQARQLRKNIERRKRRKAAMYRLLDESGCVAKGVDAQAWRLLDPYKLRSEALSRDLSELELGRILINLATRRGFKSNRKTDKKDTEAKGQALRQKQLEEKLGTKTLGQYLYEQHEVAQKAIRFRSNSEFYPTRLMYEDEFSRIRARQEKLHPGFDWDRAFRIIFFQRPLKRPDRAPCTFYPEEYRGYRAQPSAQRFRILQDIANLNYLDDSGHTKELTVEQKTWLYGKLKNQQTLGFEVLRSKWDIAGPFSLESGTRTELKGDETSIRLRKYFGVGWEKMSLQEQDEIVEELILEEDDGKLRQMLESKGLSKENADLVLSLDFPVGTSSDSARFMRNVSEIMETRWCRYDEAVKALGLHHSDLPKQALRERLPYYGEVIRYATVLPKATAKFSEEELKNPEMLFGRIPNPTVHIALNQLGKLVNALIDRFGKPDEIVLEFANELKKGQKAREKDLKRQEDNKRKNDHVKQELQALIGLGDAFKPSRNDIRKYILWEELGQDHTGRTCVYCGATISARQLVNGEAEVEHILPFSRSLDNSMTNLTVAHKRCNLAKGNRSPYEAFGSNPAGYRWEDICERAKQLRSWRKRALFTPEILEKLRGDDFIASQLTDTAYISKAACDYLSCICNRDKVRAIPGMLTAEFRSQWGFNTILSSGLGKNRSDHRHHAVDALVIGLTDRGMLQAASRANAAAQGPGIMAPPCPIERAVLVDKLKGMLISVKPDHGKGGALLAETAYGYLEHKTETLSGDSQIARDCYRIRKPINSLSWTETQERIIDPLIARNITERLAAKGIDTKTDKKALEAALMAIELETGIHRIRIKPKNETGYLHLSAGKGNRQGHKAYQFADVLCVDIWMLPRKDGKVEYIGDYFKRIDVPPEAEEPLKRRPEGAAKHLMRLYKNDIICIRKSGEITYSRIAGFSSTNNKMDLQPLCSANTIDEWLENTAPQFVDHFWKPQKGQNFISINSLFQRTKPTDSISKLTITIDGRHKRR